MEWILIHVIVPFVIGALIGFVVAILIILYRERRKLRMCGTFKTYYYGYFGLVYNDWLGFNPNSIP